MQVGTLAARLTVLQIEVRDENLHHVHHDPQHELGVLKTFRTSVAFCKVMRMVMDLAQSE